MTRHSFIQMSKLSNVKGRINYITSHARQENLYATYQTVDSAFWSALAKEAQIEFKRSNVEGKCIEAMELIIALPEEYTKFNPQQVLESFTDEFRKRYNVECVSALHHNKRKTNYHIHLIFSERRLLEQPEIKTASRNLFYNEQGKRVRTKKEVLDESGKLRKGCTIIKKGEVYEQHMFTVKDKQFKGEPFLQEVKTFYTDLINKEVADPEHKLKVFESESVYLPTKKIGKNNPRAAEIEADNVARQEWNRTADLALVSGIEEVKILAVKKEEIQEKTSESIKQNGWLPKLFRSIVSKAKELLRDMIRTQQSPPKPVLSIDMDEYRVMQKLMIKVQDEAAAIRRLQDVELPKLQTQLAETKGLFKGKERKALEQKIQQTEKTIAVKLDAIPTILQGDGYPDAEVFIAAFKKATEIVEQYRRDLSDWERKVKSNQAPDRQSPPPEKQSVRNRLRQLQAESKQHRSRNRHSQDRDR